MKLDIEGTKVKMTVEIEGGKEQVEANLPLVAGCQEPIAEWKIPNMRGIMSARTKPLTVIPAAPADARITVTKFSLPDKNKQCKYVDKDNIDELVRLLHEEAKVI
jgi:electron transfer flavoprotein beta subunit